MVIVQKDLCFSNSLEHRFRKLAMNSKRDLSKCYSDDLFRPAVNLASNNAKGAEAPCFARTVYGAFYF